MNSLQLRNTARKLIRLADRQDAIQKALATVTEKLNDSLSPEITAREQEVFQLLCENKANKEIGNALNISCRTVKFHVSSLLSKYKVQSRYDLFSKIGRGFKIVLVFIALLSTSMAAQTQPSLTYSCPNGTVGIQWSCAPAVKNIPPPWKFTIGSGALPNWMSLDSNTGVLSGIPSVSFSLNQEPGPPPPTNLNILLAKLRKAGAFKIVKNKA